ncbi:MAG: J domain-containing protein [Rhodospirillales bacterium]
MPRKADPPPLKRACDVPGCDGPGEHRAPRARDRLDQHYWFCLEHVRQYNAAWDYYAGMSSEEIEAHRRADTTWRRPSWPLGGGAAAANGKPRRPIRFDLFDGMGILDDFEIPGAARVNGRFNGKAGPGKGGGRATVGEALRRALAVLDLEPPVAFAAVKARYTALVKRHHPDANGGDRAAEERLKTINEAFAVLKAFYLPQTAPIY